MSPGKLSHVIETKNASATWAQSAQTLGRDAYARRVRKIANVVEDGSPEEQIRAILTLMQQQRHDIAQQRTDIADLKRRVVTSERPSFDASKSPQIGSPSTTPTPGNRRSVSVPPDM